MFAVLKDDLVIGTATGQYVGPEIPVPLRALRREQLRFDGTNIVDIAAITQWYIDDGGAKHLAQSDPGWQSLTCGWDAALIDDAGTWRVVNDADTLTRAKAAAKRRLSTLAEVQRQRYITPGDGKAAIYALKRDEALRWQAIIDALGTPILGDFPWINARATRLSVTGQAVADEWNAKAAAWEAIGRAIEDAYEGAIEDVDLLVDAATADADIAAIIDGVVWP